MVQQASDGKGSGCNLSASQAYRNGFQVRDKNALDDATHSRKEYLTGSKEGSKHGETSYKTRSGRA